MEQSVQTRIFKIIVIGDSNVGKTCLTVRFCGGAFPANTEATIGVDFREKAVEIEGEHIKVQQEEKQGGKRERAGEPGLVHTAFSGSRVLLPGGFLCCYRGDFLKQP